MSVREGNSGTDGGWIRAKARGSFAVVRVHVRGGPAGPLLGWLHRARPRLGLGRTWVAGPKSGARFFSVFQQFIVFLFPKLAITCKFKIELCRSPKIAKPILLVF
jgi:hypothetical protein